jgi:hypothetical protein
MPETVIKNYLSPGRALSRLGQLAGGAVLVGVAAELAVNFIDSDLSIPQGRLRLITAAAWLVAPLLAGLALIVAGSCLRGGESSKAGTSSLLYAVALICLSPLVVLFLDAKLILAAPPASDLTRFKIQIFGGAACFVILSCFLALVGHRVRRLGNGS